MEVRERIAALRELMVGQGLDAYLVPSTDPHQSEYVAEAWQRRPYISGFDGSAGTVVIGRERAGLWTDSRYFMQAEGQLLHDEVRQGLVAEILVRHRLGRGFAPFRVVGGGRLHAVSRELVVRQL